MSPAGDRSPRAAYPAARKMATCHTAVASPIAPVATAVPR